MSSPEEREGEDPIVELRDLEEKPRPGFFDRIRHSVERRRLTSDSADLFMTALRVIFLEFVDMVFHAFGSRRDKEGDSS